MTQKLAQDPKWINAAKAPSGSRSSSKFITEVLDRVNTQLTNSLLKNNPKNVQTMTKWIREFTKSLNPWKGACDLLKSVYDPDALIPAAWMGAIQILKSMDENESLRDILMENTRINWEEPPIEKSVSTWSEACNLLQAI